VDNIEAMRKATLYFHYPCFDSLPSAVLAFEFLESHEDWRIIEFQLVDYMLRETWRRAFTDNDRCRLAQVWWRARFRSIAALATPKFRPVEKLLNGCAG
jgi:hypothetical protein